MYKIGEFSKITGLSIRTLRYYDEIGILTPTTDRWTNYRLYTDENIIEAQYIKFLKSVDFRLEEILTAKDEMNSELIDSKIEELEDKKNVIDYQIECLNTLKESITNENSIANDKVVTLSKTMNQKVA